MSNQLSVESKQLPVTAEAQKLLNDVFLKGDISSLSDQDKIKYVGEFTTRLGLDPFTQPFMILKTGGKQSLYATKAAAEQLCRIHDVSISIMDKKIQSGLASVTARASMPHGRHADATGIVTVQGQSGDSLCNSLMKAETKAMRRATLRLLGLGMLDETEIETIPKAQTVAIPETKATFVKDEDLVTDVETGEVTKPDQPLDWQYLHEMAKQNRWPVGYVEMWLKNALKSSSEKAVYDEGIIRFSRYNAAPHEDAQNIDEPAYKD
jgi:hypothetical protein